MNARVTASGGDSTVAVVWTVFAVILVVLIVAAVLMLLRYRRSRATLRSEGLGPLSAGALRLGELADRPLGAHRAAEPVVEAEDDPPMTPADVEARLREIADLHDQGVLDDEEYERQRARMTDPQG